MEKDEDTEADKNEKEESNWSYLNRVLLIDQYSDSIKYFNYLIIMFATYNCIYLPLEIAF